MKKYMILNMEKLLGAPDTFNMVGKYQIYNGNIYYCFFYMEFFMRLLEWSQTEGVVWRILM